MLRTEHRPDWAEPTRRFIEAWRDLHLSGGGSLSLLEWLVAFDVSLDEEHRALLAQRDRLVVEPADEAGGHYHNRGGLYSSRVRAKLAPLRVTVPDELTGRYRLLEDGVEFRCAPMGSVTLSARIAFVRFEACMDRVALTNEGIAVDLTDQRFRWRVRFG